MALHVRPQTPCAPSFCEGAHEGAHGAHEGNGYAISTTPENRRPAEDPTDLEIPPFLRRENPEDLREIRHPAISSGPDDDLADFAPDLN